MSDVLDPDSMDDSAPGKPDFFAQVVESKHQDPDNPVPEEYLNEGEEQEDYFHQLYELDVLEVPDDPDADWKNLTEFSIRKRDRVRTKWGVLMCHLQDIFGNLSEQGIEGSADLAEFLEGKVFKFRDITWSEDAPVPGQDFTYGDLGADSTQPMNNFIVPVEHVDDDQRLAEFGVEPDVEPDENVDDL